MTIESFRDGALLYLFYHNFTSEQYAKCTLVVHIKSALTQLKLA